MLMLSTLSDSIFFLFLVYMFSSLSFWIMELSNFRTSELKMRVDLLFSCSVLSDSWQPYGLQPTGLPCPWDFPGKNSGVDCPLISRGSFRPRNQTRVSCTAGICLPLRHQGNLRVDCATFKGGSCQVLLGQQNF